MLQAIRDKAQGWIAWAIVILISIPFALWGIQEYLGVGSEPEVAIVNGEPITQRMLDQRTRDFRESMRDTLGNAYDPDLFEDSTLKPQVRDAMIEERILGDTALDWNLRTSDVQARGFIASVPAFQRDGGFDQQSYEAAVRNRGMSRAGFEQTVRQELAVSQLRTGISESAFVTESGLAARVRLFEQTRDVNFARIPAAAYADSVEVSPTLLREFYDANPDLFRTPERVKLAYVILDATSLGGLIEVDEAALRQYFEDHRSEFVAREERQMRHILVAVSAGADEATNDAARDEAQSLLTRLRDGEDFAELARAHSDDPGSANNGGDLGWVERGLMVPEFEEAGFALALEAISDVVRTDFGYHIIQVTGVRGGSDADFADVRDQVDAAYRKFEGENLYFDYAERLAESAYENADSLAPAAEALGLQIRQTDWVTRDSSLDGALDSPKVLNLAFSDDVLVGGNNSELIEVGAQQAIVLRVAEQEPAGIKDFDQHLATVEELYRRSKTAEAAASTGESLLTELRDGGKTLADVASTHAWKFEQFGDLARNDSRAPADVVRAAFALTPPADGSAALAGEPAANGDYWLIEVASVEGGSVDDIGAAERPLVSQQMAGDVAAAQLRYLTSSLRERADVELKPIADE
ncbi:MAG: SurA N-terminal domain-containing protein [Gammaproteobacteria bacterium]|nr:SurA N-terminal domain-containing protein [Gammaproteobacteria bacterium]